MKNELRLPVEENLNEKVSTVTKLTNASARSSIYSETVFTLPGSKQIFQNFSTENTHNIGDKSKKI